MTVTLLRNLDRRKFRLTLAVVDMTEAFYSDEIPSDVEVIDLKSVRVRSALLKIVNIIWQRRPDIVFSVLGSVSHALAILRPLLPNGVRYIARESTIVSQLNNAYRMPSWWYLVYKRFYARFDSVVCQSAEMQRDLVDNFGVPAIKTLVIVNPVDVDHIRRLCGEPIDTGITYGDGAVLHLVAVGSLTAVKGFDVLIEALSQVHGRRFELTVLGDGPLLAELQHLVRARGLSRSIRFVGFQRNPYVFMRKADALVLSSRFEGFPNVVLEALACGTPVIATPSPGGVREILDAVDGCVLAAGCSARSLAEAVAGFSAGRRIAPEVVDRYSVAKVVSRYEQLFLGLSLSACR